LAADSHAQGRTDGSAGVAYAKGVVVTFVSLGKVGQAAALAHAVHPLAAVGEDLMGIGLMTHVPDQTVIRSLVNIVQRSGRLDNAQPSAKVTTGLADGIDRKSVV